MSSDEVIEKFEQFLRGIDHADWIALVERSVGVYPKEAEDAWVHINKVV